MVAGQHRLAQGVSHYPPAVSFRMGKKTLIGIGIAVVCCGSFGVFNALSDLRETAAKVHDVTTTGKVARVKPQGPSSPGAGDGQLVLKYFFRAEDGRVYFGQQTIDNAETNPHRQGDRITVHYQSEDPRISTLNAAQEEFAGTDPMLRLIVCGGTVLFGLLIVVVAFFCKEDHEGKDQPATIRKFSDDPQAALRQWKSEWNHQPEWC